jgi:hypothetical protein
MIMGVSHLVHKNCNDSVAQFNSEPTEVFIPLKTTDIPTPFLKKAPPVPL